MLIPTTMLKPDTLLALIEEFVTRDGTDYGEREITLAAKVTQVKRQLERDEVAIVFDPETESCSIIARSDPRFAELTRLREPGEPSRSYADGQRFGAPTFDAHVPESETFDLEPGE